MGWELSYHRREGAGVLGQYGVAEGQVGCGIGNAGDYYDRGGGVVVVVVVAGNVVRDKRGKSDVANTGQTKINMRDPRSLPPDCCDRQGCHHY